jgi:hypothetical protein
MTSYDNPYSFLTLPAAVNSRKKMMVDVSKHYIRNNNGSQRELHHKYTQCYTFHMEVASQNESFIAGRHVQVSCCMCLKVFGLFLIFLLSTMFATANKKEAGFCL